MAMPSWWTASRASFTCVPDDAVTAAFRDKMAMQAKAQERYASIRDKPAETLCGTHITLKMNAGLMADLPSLESSGADGVGLFRTELQFLIRSHMPKRAELSALYARVMDAAKGRRVVFRTLDIGSDKVLPYMTATDEPNPAMGWRAVRVALEKPGVMRMQLQALIRGAQGRPLSVMFPFVAQHEEFRAARAEMDKALERERILGHPLPSEIEVGAMLETPSLAFAPDVFYNEVDFLSVGGNDLKQFFFAADRENERVRRRYDTLDMSYLNFLEGIVYRCATLGTRLSFCGEDAGRPIEAACLAALGFRTLSMRPASIGPVKSILRRSNLASCATSCKRSARAARRTCAPPRPPICAPSSEGPSSSGTPSSCRARDPRAPEDDARPCAPAPPARCRRCRRAPCLPCAKGGPIMGQLVNGVWHDTWYDTAATGGEFVRDTSKFRNWITPDGAPGPSGEGGFKAQGGRYHLYVAYACPWAHRALIFRALKGLDDHIGVSVVHPDMLSRAGSSAPIIPAPPAIGSTVCPMPATSISRPTPGFRAG